jgi:hypothetical protein
MIRISIWLVVITSQTFFVAYHLPIEGIENFRRLRGTNRYPANTTNKRQRTINQQDD